MVSIDFVGIAQALPAALWVILMLGLIVGGGFSALVNAGIDNPVGSMAGAISLWLMAGFCFIMICLR